MCNSIVNAVVVIKAVIPIILIFTIDVIDAAHVDVNQTVFGKLLLFLLLKLYLQLIRFVSLPFLLM